MSTPQENPSQQKVLVKDVQVNNDSTAINLMAFMLEVAHRRGAFTLEEASKIHECISQIQKSASQAPPAPVTQPVSINDSQAKEILIKTMLHYKYQRLINKIELN